MQIGRPRAGLANGLAYGLANGLAYGVANGLAYGVGGWQGRSCQPQLIYAFIRRRPAARTRG